LISRTRAPIAVLPALIVIALGLAVGCGDSGDTSSTDTSATVEAGQKELDKAQKIRTEVDASDVVKVFPPNIVTDGDVAAEKKGTPERALLEWWQAYQFTDLDAVFALTSSRTIDALGKRNLEELVLTRGPGLQGIEVLGTTVSGDRATLEVGLLTFQPNEPGDPPPREPTSSRPDTITMVRENGAWKFDQADYLQLQLDGLRRSQAAAKEAGG
jgi:hypothetical protein